MTREPDYTDPTDPTDPNRYAAAEASLANIRRQIAELRELEHPVNRRPMLLVGLAAFFLVGQFAAAYLNVFGYALHF